MPVLLLPAAARGDYNELKQPVAAAGITTHCIHSPNADKACCCTAPSAFALAAARGDYNELEQLVAGQLAGLARDASWLKSYLVASLLLGKEAMQVRREMITKSMIWCTYETAAAAAAG
jgi:hypothetical protein